MAAIPLSEIGRAIVKRNPWGGGVYIARQSFPRGATPAHLKTYTEEFTAAARACKTVVAGAKGKDKVTALRACIGSKLTK